MSQKANGDARLYRKGKTASKLRKMGHTLNDNCRGLIANAMATQADRHAKRDAANAMVNDVRHALGDDEREITVGENKVCDAKELIDACKAMKVTPRMAQNKSGRNTAVLIEIAQTEGYASAGPRRSAACAK